MYGRTFLQFFALLLSASTGLMLSANSAQALPWDIDMYRQESLRASEIARAPAVGTVPMGRKPFTLSVEEAEKVLSNPVPFSLHSVWRGQRLWNANCTPCHGASGGGEGAVAKQFIGIPDLLGDLYKQRNDGRVFAVIHHGQGTMPRYGYKFSTGEKWDIVNYLRFLQGRDILGLERPSGKKE